MIAPPIRSMTERASNSSHNSISCLIEISCISYFDIINITWSLMRGKQCMEERKNESRYRSKEKYSFCKYMIFLIKRWKLFDSFRNYKFVQWATFCISIAYSTLIYKDNYVEWEWSKYVESSFTIRYDLYKNRITWVSYFNLCDYSSYVTRKSWMAEKCSKIFKWVLIFKLFIFIFIEFPLFIS